MLTDHITPKGRKIHKEDFREGYDPIPASVPKPKCAGCGVETSHELHWGVYVTICSYAVFHSEECAFKFGDSVYDEDGDAWILNHMDDPSDSIKQPA